MIELAQQQTCRLSGETLAGAPVLLELTDCPLPGIYPEEIRESVDMRSPAPSRAGARQRARAARPPLRLLALRRLRLRRRHQRGLSRPSRVVRRRAPRRRRARRRGARGRVRRRHAARAAAGPRPRRRPRDRPGAGRRGAGRGAPGHPWLLPGRPASSGPWLALRAGRRPPRPRAHRNPAGVRRRPRRLPGPRRGAVDRGARPRRDARHRALEQLLPAALQLLRRRYARPARGDGRTALRRRHGRGRVRRLASAALPARIRSGAGASRTGRRASHKDLPRSRTAWPSSPPSCRRDPSATARPSAPRSRSGPARRWPSG